MTSQTEPAPQTEQVERLPNWTVWSNLKRHETTDWIGHCIEFFDEEIEAVKCFERHRKNGDVSTMRPFHSSDKPMLHIMSTSRKFQVIGIFLPFSLVIFLFVGARLPVYLQFFVGLGFGGSLFGLGFRGGGVGHNSQSIQGLDRGQNRSFSAHYGWPS